MLTKLGELLEPERRSAAKPRMGEAPLSSIKLINFIHDALKTGSALKFLEGSETRK
jgi:hypothetical protein